MTNLAETSPAFYDEAATYRPDETALGELRRIVMAPIVGSGLEFYTHDYMLLDTPYNGVSALRRLPFGHCTTVSISADPDVWRQRFENRYPAHAVERSNRLAEAM